MSAYLTLAARLLTAAREKKLKKVVLSKSDDKSILRREGTLCFLRGTLMLQFETRHTDGKATHQNLAPETLNEETLLPYLLPFAQINLLSLDGDAELRRGKKGAVLLGKKVAAATAETVEIGGNNKEKKHILSGDEPFLRLLGVSDANGRVFDKKGAKFRQINRFLELIRDTLPHLPKGRIRICDLCCGKSYLSFAVYHYFANILGFEVSMTGVDLKPDVIAYCREVAEKLGFTGLTFLCGDIRTYESTEAPHLTVSLHACDTATDLVLEKAAAWESRVILSTPCCHHELNHTLNCQALSFLAEHSMLRQKFCDAATDALRLKLLEARGYDVAAIELIDPDDTPKNIMLRAIRRADAGSGTARERRAAEEYRAARAFLLGE